MYNPSSISKYCSPPVREPINNSGLPSESISTTAGAIFIPEYGKFVISSSSNVPELFVNKNNCPASFPMKKSRSPSFP